MIMVKRARPAKMLTLSPESWRQLDAMAAAHGTSRSAEVERLVRKGLAWSYKDYWLAVIGDVDADTAVSKYGLVPGDVLDVDEWLDEAESLAHVPRGSEKMSTWHDRAARALHAAANRTRGD